MKIINDFFKVNTNNIIGSFAIYFVLVFLIGAKKGIINTGEYWLMVLIGAILILMLGFIFSILLKCHKE